MGTKEDFIKIFKTFFHEKNEVKAKTLIEKKNWNNEFKTAFELWKN